MRWFALAIVATGFIGDVHARWFKVPWDTRVGIASAPVRETGRIKQATVVGWSPKPTPSPGQQDESEVVLELLKRGGIDGRQNTWLNSKTCGWFAGTSSSPYTCDGKSTCKTNQQNAVACVSGTFEPFFTVCFDFKASKAGACDNLGDLTGCCVSSDRPACATFVWEGTPVKSMFQCGASPDYVSLLNEPQFVRDATTTTSMSTSKTTSASTTTSQTSTGTSTPGAGSSGPSTGAIAGGVVGGLAGLGLAGATMWYFMRRGRRKGNGSQTYNAVPSGEYGGASGHVPLGSPPLTHSPGHSPYPPTASTAYDPRQSYYDAAKLSGAPAGTHPYYTPMQSPPPPGMQSQYLGTYDPSHQPPTELDATVIAHGASTNPAEMSAETPTVAKRS